MDQQSNPWSLASLGLGVGVWFVWFAGMCVGLVIPFLSTLAFPITWMMAIVGLVTGMIGYRTAMVQDGEGRGSALLGIALNLTWIVLQVLIMVLLFVFVGGIFGIALLAVLADAMQ